jgi:hypothetical protein
MGSETGYALNTAREVLLGSKDIDPVQAHRDGFVGQLMSDAGIRPSLSHYSLDHVAQLYKHLEESTPPQIGIGLFGLVNANKEQWYGKADKTATPLEHCIRCSRSGPGYPCLRGPDDQVLECPTCRRYFETSNCLAYHQANDPFCSKPNQKRHHRRVCHICEQSFETETALNFHLVKQHDIWYSQSGEPIRVSMCGVCGALFQSVWSRDQHQFSVHNMSIAESGRRMKRFDCGICDKTFKQEGHAHQHRFTAHGVIAPGVSYSTFVCNLCEYVCSGKQQLARHVTAVHSLSLLTANEHNEMSKLSIEERGLYRNIADARLIALLPHLTKDEKTQMRVQFAQGERDFSAFWHLASQRKERLLSDYDMLT